MGNVKVHVDYNAGRALLNSSEVRTDLQRRVSAIASRAGDGYVADVQKGKTRLAGMVKTGTIKAIRSNAKNNTLLKSIDAGR
ncbi:MAG: hypothetical protein LBQ21_07465 [Clostridiales Family XIII bacterium]|jgi:hypothetical protein|nr:hypothetical protein [Clostridiales Family XIII bacterium]